MDSNAFGGGGEARRKEMLEIAIDLEKRYALLLPPEPRRPKKKEKKEIPEAARIAIAEDADTEEDVTMAMPPASVTKPTARERTSHRSAPQQQPPLPVPPSPGAPKTPAITVAIEAREGRNHGPRGPYLPPNAFNAPPSPPKPSRREASSRVKTEKVGKKTGKKTEISESPPPSTGQVPSAPPPEEEVSLAGSPPPPPVDPSSVPPPRKRQRKTEPRRKSTPMGGPPSHTTSVLLQTAMRRAAQPNARQTARKIHAFGIVVPEEIGEELHYELPPWLISQVDLEAQYQKKMNGYESVSDADPPGMEGMEPPRQDIFDTPEPVKTEIDETPEPSEQEEHGTPEQEEQVVHGTPEPADDAAPTTNGIPESSADEVEMNGQGTVNTVLDMDIDASEPLVDGSAYTNGVDVEMELDPSLENEVTGKDN
ncbi:hypothetical protein M422DRAFT_268875 [Sphaerobolus stellatus SS14]|uniref:Uncharacterized protein n=1 Tax=Sphaerobolus stellatus (strain SS14) TaxID=990650 RepID=A0A0C9ULE9_SPHS4|nr:hypothetical protein M422DRAFT_268875 [Sphaerobolus stellatus SS14]